MFSHKIHLFNNFNPDIEKIYNIEFFSNVDCIYVPISSFAVLLRRMPDNTWVEQNINYNKLILESINNFKNNIPNFEIDILFLEFILTDSTNLTIYSPNSS